MSRIERYIEVEMKQYTEEYRERVRKTLVEFEEWRDPVAPQISEVRQYIEENDLHVKGSRRHVVYRRFYLYAFIKLHYDLSYAAIGEMFGGKDHATVMRGVKEHYRWVAQKDHEYFVVTDELQKLFPI